MRKKCTILYALKIFVLIAAVSFSAIYCQITVTANVEGIIPIIMHYIMYNIKSIALFLYLIAGNFYLKPTLTFLNAFSEIDEDMRDLGCKINYKNLHVVQYVYMAYILVKINVQMIVYNVGEPFSLITLTNCIVFTVPLNMAHTISFQWFTGIGLVTLHFRELNELIKSVKYRHCFVVEDLQQKRELPTRIVIKRLSFFL